MIATPCGPSAVPTGGAGVAAPAGIWILTMAATRFFAMGEKGYLPFRAFKETELHGRPPPEDVDQHLELELVLVDLGDLAGEVGERPLPDSDALTHLVLQP